MPRVIQVRNVPDDVHDALAAAAQAQGLSLTRFLLGEIEQVAKRSQIAGENALVLRRTRAEIGRRVDRDTILAAVHEGRDE